MLTVIIAPEKFIDSYEQYSLFTGNLFRNRDLAFCRCCYDADNLQSMVPDLYSIIADCDKWRAVIVAPDNRQQFNPFDYTGYCEKENKKSACDWSFYTQRRQRRFENYERASKNPLMLLTSSLCGNAYSKLFIAQKDYEAIVNGNISEYSYLLEKRLSTLNLKRLVYRLRSFKDETLTSFAGEESYDAIVDAIEKSDVDAITNLLGEDRIIDFIRILGGDDPLYTDPEIIEEELCNFKKHLILSELEEEFTFYDKAPEEVRCVALRSCDTETYHNSIKHKPAPKSKYSFFSQHNMYHPSLEFFVFDILSENDKRYELDYIKFLSFLTIFAVNDFPRGTVSNGYLYRIECEYDSKGFARLCQNYINKLYATHSEINKRIFEISQKRKTVIDDFTAEQTFEAPVTVPVSIRISHPKSDLMAQCNVGLSKDCPEDEEALWDSQHKSIIKKFIRYLREPRRAVKTSVKGSFREDSSVVDDRIRSLNEYQLEDVVFKLEEEERKMVETSTSQIFNVSEYNKRIDKASKKIDNRIKHRMTRFKTLIVSGIAILAYLIGLLPLLFSEHNNVGTISFSLLLTLSALSVFAASGLVTLFVFRKQLKDLFKKFNGVMGEICREIDNSLESFSKYLSYACNVMRKFSIINYDKHPENDVISILTKHKMDIEKQIKLTVAKYSVYIDTDNIDKKVDPYLYDFSKLCDYEYKPDSVSYDNVIDFIVSNNKVHIPVDYIKSVIAVKEDLYD